MTTFCAKHWISTKCYGGETLRPEAIDAICNFTLIWNFFEGAVCNNHASINTFERRATSIITQCVSLPVEIQDAVRFWMARYLTDGKFNNLFYGLHFRQPNDRREYVEAVLRGETNDPQSQLLAVMIIIYRLRNNLFHGLKQIDSLNEQIPNLTVACQALATIVQISQPPIIQKAA